MDNYEELKNKIMTFIGKKQKVRLFPLYDAVPEIEQSNEVLDKMEEDNLVWLSHEGSKMWVNRVC